MLLLQDGSQIPNIDAVIYCTGYQYAYPFLEGTDIVTCHDMRVTPLWQHIFPPSVAPTLAFIGLLWKSLRNPQFELQACSGSISSACKSTPPPAPVKNPVQQCFACFECYSKFHNLICRQGPTSVFACIKAVTEFIVCFACNPQHLSNGLALALIGLLEMSFRSLQFELQASFMGVYERQSGISIDASFSALQMTLLWYWSACCESRSGIRILSCGQASGCCNWPCIVFASKAIQECIWARQI